jgi:hypothetical protein
MFKNFDNNNNNNNNYNNDYNYNNYNNYNNINSKNFSDKSNTIANDFFLNNNLKNFGLDYNNTFFNNSNNTVTNSNDTNTENSKNTKNSINTINTINTNNNIMDKIIKNPNPFALGESKEKEKPLDIYSTLPTTEFYMKYYKSLGEKIGKEFLKINLDKIIDTTEPHRTQFAEPPSLELSLENSKPDSSTHSPNLISSLYNIEISVYLLENLTTCSTLVSTKIIKLMESIWNQKCFQFTHTLGLLHFHKNKKYYEWLILIHSRTKSQIIIEIKYYKYI